MRRPWFLATRALVQATPDGLVLPAAAAGLLGVAPGRQVGTVAAGLARQSGA